MLKKLYTELKNVYKPKDIHKLHRTRIKMNPWNEDKIEHFNKVVAWLENNGTKFSWSNVGFISNKRGFRLPAYNITLGNFWVDLTIVSSSGAIARIQIRFTEKTEENENAMQGHQAFQIFKAIAEKFGIDLKKYQINNGKEVKETEFPKYKIWLDSRYKDNIFDCAHHIDFHSSFPAGLANTHPEFRPMLEWIYSKRKESEEMKAVLNYSIGYMQSIGGCQAKWAHLSKDAIADNNKRLEELEKKLRNSGRVIIAFNTDGIWYAGKIYHGEGEGNKLGDWENDHTNCKLRYKTPGSYEYVEDGKYKPVVRGKTTLDREKPREEWEWGDIYKMGSYNQIIWDGHKLIEVKMEE